MNNDPSYVMISYVKEGNGRLDLGFLDLEVNKGELYIIPLSEADRLQIIEAGSEFQLIKIVHRTDSLGMAAPLLPMKWKVYKQYKEEMIKLLERMSSYQETNELYSGDFVLIWSLFMEFLLSQPIKADLQTFGDDGTSIQEVFNIIGKNFMNSIPVSEMSRRLAMSTRQFQRNFKSLTGRTYKQFLQELRIRHSCGLLKFTRLSVQSIAECVGIYDMYHFYRVFREYCGMTPGAFRQLSQNE
ncbi:HTH-type transcriptional activator Btr [compost metagenome]